MGATDTLSSVVSFGLQLVMESPSILAKIQKELDTVLGPDRLPSLDDRYKSVSFDFLNTVLVFIKFDVADLPFLTHFSRHGFSETRLARSF